MKLLDRIILWRAKRRHRKHQAWLRRNRVHMHVERAPWPGSVVKNQREPH